MSVATERSTQPHDEKLKAGGARSSLSTTALPARKSRGLPLVLAAAVLAAAAGVGLYLFTHKSANDAPTILTYTTQLDSFDVKIPLSGELKAIRTTEIRCMVDGNTTIISLIPEGAHVNEGDVLVTLASDAIKDKLEESRIRLENATAARVNAEETLKIQEMQNESDNKAAETNAKLAQMEYEQFDRGDGPVQLETNKTALANAETDLERKQKDHKEVEELSAKGFVSDNDVLDAKIAERDSQNKLDTARSNLDVWIKYAEPRQRATLQLKANESLAEVERVKRKCRAAVLLKEAAVRAAQSTERVEQTRYKGFQQQLDACSIKAPQPGMVVYQSSIQQGWQSQGPIEEGATVHQNQVLIQLPDISRMQVEVRLAEQLTDRVAAGQDVSVTVDALPGKVLHGKIDTIAVLPDSAMRWMNVNLKEYLTEIVLDDTPAGVKPGMSAKVEIMASRLTDVLAVPLQAVKPYVFVGSPENYEKRFIVTGASSSTRIEIKDGLRIGEVVLLSRPKNAPEDPPAMDATSRPGRKKRPPADVAPAAAQPAVGAAPAVRG